jgi:hypothetical protein
MPSTSTSAAPRARIADLLVKIHGQTAVLALIAQAACAAPDVPESKTHPNPWYPLPQPCWVDKTGNVTDAGGQPAMCCPAGFIAGGAPMSPDCQRGTCCPFSDEMGTPPRMPTPGVGPLPPK